MFGQEKFDMLAKLSEIRQRAIANNAKLEFLYAAIGHQLNLTHKMVESLFQGVDVYDKYFLVTELEQAQ